jgi:serine/threonine protein kinase
MTNNDRMTSTKNHVRYPDDPPSDEWKDINERYRYRYRYVLGKGSYSQVYEGFDRKEKRRVAIKRIDLQIVPEAYIRRLPEELSLMKDLNFRYIIRTYDVIFPESSIAEPESSFICTESKYIYIIMEYCSGGDFSKYLKNQANSSKGLKENRVRYYLYQLMRGLNYLRERNILHRDLKPSNLLLSEDHLVLKIADFGFARRFDETDLSRTICGSPLYMAPEMLLSKKYNNKSDLWSVGVIMYEALYGTPVYNAVNIIELYSMIKNVPVTYPKNVPVSMACLDCLHRLLQKEPEKRMSWSEFYSHQWWIGVINEFQNAQIATTMEPETVGIKMSTPVHHPKQNNQKRIKEQNKSEGSVIVRKFPLRSNPIPIPESSGSFNQTKNISISLSPTIIDDYIPNTPPTSRSDNHPMISSGERCFSFQPNTRIEMIRESPLIVQSGVTKISNLRLSTNDSVDIENKEIDKLTGSSGSSIWGILSNSLKTIINPSLK